MKKGYSGMVLFFLGLMILFGMEFPGLAQEALQKKACPPDKESCARMIRHGREAFERGRYGEARAYFRKAVAADPESEVAWRHYDMAILYDMGRQIATTGKYIPAVPPVTITVPETRPSEEKAVTPAPSSEKKPQAAPTAERPVKRPVAQPTAPEGKAKPAPVAERPIEKKAAPPSVPAETKPAAPEQKPPAQKEPVGAIIVEDEGC